MRGLLCAEMKRRASKRRRIDGGGEEAMVDHLSVLPDDILFSIISSIPVKEAVRTSILSRRWRNLHTLLPRLDNLRLDPVSMNCKFSKKSYFSLQRDKKWVEAVDRQLLSQRGLIRRCRIQNPMLFLGANHYDRWIEELMGKGIQELALNHLKSPSSIPPCIPPRVLDVKSLTVLDLKNCMIPSRPDDAGCINLRTLKLDRVILDEEVLKNIIFRSGQLERLHMVYCGGLETCMIRASSLKHLWLESSSGVRSISINAPNLQTLTLYTRPLLEKLDLCASKVKKVYLNLAQPRGELVTRLKGFLAVATDLTCLTLRGASVKILTQESEAEGFPTPLQLLRILSLSVNFKDELQCFFMVELLESCPQLWQLSLSIAECDESDLSGKFSKYKKRLRGLQCLTHHLEQVKLSGFMADTYQMKLGRLILRKAKALKNITLWLRRRCSAEQITAAKDLLSLKRASTEGKLISHTIPRIQIL